MLLVGLQHDLARLVTMLLRCNRASATLGGLQGRFYDAATTEKDFKLRFFCAYDDAFQSYYDLSHGAALGCALKPLLSKSVASPGFSIN